MKNNGITVSYIVTVYNKAPYLPATVRSILQQEGGIPSEYIFVDDVSTDHSVQVLEDCTRGHPNVVILRNSVNSGPSVRLNQGARLARGEYLQFFDSDDIMAANATRTMLSLLQMHNADLVYGQWQRTQEEGPSLIGRRIPDHPPFEVSDEPLGAVLAGHFVRMTLMTKRELFIEAGGADETVFIQDESLPLRLAVRARKFIELKAPVLYVPRIEGALSGNKSQLNHDRFLACLHMLDDQYYEHIAPVDRSQLYRRCVSAAWKEARARNAFRAHFSKTFFRYVASRLQPLPMNKAYLQELERFFAAIPGVRRV